MAGSMSARLIRLEVRYASLGIDTVVGTFDFPDSIYATINSHTIPLDPLTMPDGPNWNEIVTKVTDMANQTQADTWGAR